MKLEIGFENDEKLKFTLKGAGVGFSNMLRRFAIGQVPTYAVSNVTMYENTSSIFSEYIAHRVGLVPLKSAHIGKKGEDVMLTLEATGPCTVMSKELKSGHEKVKISNPGIPIVLLTEDQNLRLEAKATLGTGREHARHQPGIVSYEIAGDELRFIAESFSQMPPREIIIRAAEIIEERCEELEEQLKQ
jgi:DNA-directed RNA polymerase subunit D